MFTMDYRGSLPESVEVAFTAEHNPGAKVVDLPTWTGSFTTPMEQLERSLAAHWDRHGQTYVDSFTFNWRKQAMILAPVMLGVLIVVSVCANIGIGFLVSLVGAAIGTLVIAIKAKDTERKQQQARELVEASKQDSIAQLRATGAELTDWNTAYQEADGQEATVRTMITGLATIGQARSPYERRVVASRSAPDTPAGALHD